MKGYQTHQADWQGIPLSVCYCPEWTRAMGRPLTHLTVKAAVPLPVSETGFKSQFIAPGTVDDEGGPVAFVGGPGWIMRSPCRNGRTGGNRRRNCPSSEIVARSRHAGGAGFPSLPQPSGRHRRFWGHRTICSKSSGEPHMSFSATSVRKWSKFGLENLYVEERASNAGKIDSYLINVVSILDAVMQLQNNVQLRQGTPWDYDEIGIKTDRFCGKGL
jgi:hypothetical protein